VEATQTFHELASEWLEGRRRDLSVHGYTDYHWQLTNHLLPFFVRHYPLEITASEIDRLRAHLLDHGLSGTSVNKCIRLLAQILDVAEDYGLVAGNPARNRRRYAKRAPKAPVWLDRPEQIEALLEAAARLDASPSSRTHGREAFIAVLLLAGLRIGEACELRWRAIDFHNDTIRVEHVAKTAASFREIDLFPGLRRRLEHERERRGPVKPGDRVFLTSAGTPRDRHNARQKIITPVVEQADELLVATNKSPLPVGVTAHKLCHTFASLLISMGYDPATVQEQLGHSDARFTLNVYTHQMRRGVEDRALLAKLLE
jgi:integrase